MLWLKRIGLALLLLIVVLVVVGFFLPEEYIVTRSVTIEAEPARVHTLVGDLKNWPQWTPWLEIDPTIVTTLGMTTTGIGASQTWTDKSGGGELTFTHCDPEDGVTYDMAFDQGKYPSIGAIRYEKDGANTLVTWEMQGENGSIINRYFGLMMDGMIGPMFENGLTKLKEKVESMPPEPMGELG